MSGTLTHVWRPSTARYLALEGFVAMPRGAAAGPQAPLAWPAKDPADVLDYQFDVAAALQGNEGDAIVALTATVSPAGMGELAVDSLVADGSQAVFWFSGGRAGTAYTVQIHIGTQSGRSISRAVVLPVLSLTSTVSPSASLTTDQGVVITDQNGNPILIGS